MSEDLQLIEESKKKSQSAFEKLYNKYAQKMKGVAYRYVGDLARAEDVVHDAFVKVYEKLHTLHDPAVFEGWLRRIVVNESIDSLKREKKLSEVINESGQFHSATTSDDRGAYEGISAQELMEALNSLPAGYRTVFNMYVVDGYSHKEIGERFNITEGTSKSQLSKAKEFLRKKLEPKLLSK
jgi:RNA polymerase sigma factor (sigma-70 family)